MLYLYFYCIPITFSKKKFIMKYSKNIPQQKSTLNQIEREIIRIKETTQSSPRNLNLSQLPEIIKLRDNANNLAIKIPHFSQKSEILPTF